MKCAIRVLGAIAGLALAGSANAGYADLTAGGITSTTQPDYVKGGGTALYGSLATSIVGTGYIDPFLRINPGGGITPEMGYNNDANQKGQQYYEDPSWTRSIQLSEVPVVTVNGIQYREFLLDINQANNKAGAQYLSLDVVRIWYGAQPTQGTYVPNSGGADYAGKFANDAAMTLAYSLDNNITKPGKSYDNAVLLDYTVCEGNPACFGAKGSGNNFDMRLLVPDSAFTGAAPTSYVTLFSAFGYLDGTSVATADGNINTWAQTDGFEEWALRPATCTGSNCIPGGVPEPGTLALLGAGLAGLALRRRGSSLQKAA